MARPLADAVWPEVRSPSVVLVPVGSVEQHGPHLPLDTDAAIADAVAQRAAALLEQADPSASVTVAPVVTYGASGEHQAFAGTCSIGTEVLTLLVVELTRSVRTWADRVVFVNAHGGNVGALRAAVSQLRQEQHDVGWAACETETVDAHAGFTETSLMLHLRPGSVRRDRAEAGNTAPIGDLLPQLLAGGVAAVSANGVLGDPSGASAAEGAHVLETMSRSVAAGIAEWSPDPAGLLRSRAPAR